MRTGWTRGALALAVAGAIAWSGARLPDAPTAAAEEAFLPDPAWVRLAALGYEALLGDYYWMRAVQIVGSEEGPYGRSQQIGRLIDLATTLDPWVDHPYRFAALWMADDAAAVRKANELLERGIAHHPDSWLNRFYLGFNHFFWFGENREAVDALKPAIGLPGAPRYLGRLVARLESEAAGGQIEAGAAFLNELLRQTEDPYKRAEYEKALDEIETERRARFLDQARAEFQRRHGRDIRTVEELVTVKPSVLRKLPAEPYGWEWVLDENGQIVSSYLGHRYSVRIDGTNRKRIERLHERSQAAEG